VVQNDITLTNTLISAILSDAPIIYSNRTHKISNATHSTFIVGHHPGQNLVYENTVEALVADKQFCKFLKLLSKKCLLIFRSKHFKIIVEIKRSFCNMEYEHQYAQFCIIKWPIILNCRSIVFKDLCEIQCQNCNPENFLAAWYLAVFVDDYPIIIHY